MATKKRQRDEQKRLSFGKEKYQERNNNNAERGFLSNATRPLAKFSHWQRPYPLCVILLSVLFDFYNLLTELSSQLADHVN